jgi:hypothetical protein
MKVKVTTIELGSAFDRAHHSLWEENTSHWNQGMSVKKQIKFWRKNFHANIYGGHFDNVDSDGEGAWNTKDAIVEFDSKEDYLMFMLEWS